MSDDEYPDEAEGAEQEFRREGRNRFQRLGDQITGLFDPEAAIRRGQEMVTGVTQATKDEVVRIVGAEVHNFLDKMDVAELAQEIIAGLVVDINVQVRFSKDEGAPVQPEVTRAQTKIGTNHAQGRGKPRGAEREREREVKREASRESDEDD